MNKSVPSIPYCNITVRLQFCRNRKIHDEWNVNSHPRTTYKKLLRLLTCCNEHQLQILLATATALLEPTADAANNSNGED